ncbi:hypothetical protein A2617_00860 [Candidatus Daviesbacteria bacterium RIFOXYD1_FULL_41_10]|uniref:Uncharacterized protein n=2 Tax=Candidatus Daviesiibacteriota TaxID=1752718 RepID=A0A1F5N2A8_9BACT|nr:MAG: hypothetical protein UU67_C0040G0018 [Candidatus Daviesbacteria bacterium GW2011_GWB1_41_5]OGE71755.1 MAG: hypothetical protein A2617_00860 [Candidatus Daviesbacteria bacterium RIFOXYD1_FULL_41_10]
MAIETERIKFDECPVPALVADAASDRDKRETAFKTCTSDLGKDIYRFAATKGHSENGRRFWQAVTTTPRGPVLLTVTCDSDFALDTHVFGQRAECGIGIWHGDDPRSGYLVNRLTICREYQPETRDIRTSVKVEETLGQYRGDNLMRTISLGKASELQSWQELMSAINRAKVCHRPGPFGPNP